MESSQKPNAISERRLELRGSKRGHAFFSRMGVCSAVLQVPACLRDENERSDQHVKNLPEKLSAKINWLSVGPPSDRNICKLRGRI
ncbi:hypothetical protein [Sinorhizobium sp. CCBAU 05631]|nr:hypothetical protein [Sinorhizobium sp. CCBAU 05631]